MEKGKSATLRALRLVLFASIAFSMLVGFAWADAPECAPPATQACKCDSGDWICIMPTEDCDIMCDNCAPLGDPCPGLMQCCDPNVCNAANICVAPGPPPNQPPAKPLTPIISPASIAVDGTVSCIANCPPNPLPIDPEGDMVKMEYLWKTTAQIGTWGQNIFFTCGVSGPCSVGDEIALMSRACDDEDHCKESELSTTTIVTGATSPTCANSGESCATLPCCNVAGLTCISGTCQIPPPTPGTFDACPTNEFDNVLLISGFAGVGMACLIGFIYIFGEFFQNPRMLMWSKSELLQVFASLAIVVIILFVLNVMCIVKVDELSGMVGIPYPAVFDSHTSSYNLFEGAFAYTEYMGAASLANMANLRYAMAAYEIRTTYSKYDCDSICLYSLSSTTISYFSGDSARLALTNNLLSTAMVAQLGIASQYFLIQYIGKGLFLEFLPLAIIIRSIPFMRNFGGALIGIIVALYILYPAMLVMDAYVVPSLAKGFTPFPQVWLYAGYGPAGNCDIVKKPFAEIRTTGIKDSIWCGASTKYSELTIKKVGIGKGTMEDINPTVDGSSDGIPATAELIKFNVLIFISAVFLPAFNFIVIAALGRELSRFLGEEADVSRLGQML